MEISKIIFLLIFGGVLIMVSAPILWGDVLASNGFRVYKMASIDGLHIFFGGE